MSASYICMLQTCPEIVFFSSFLLPLRQDLYTRRKRAFVRCISSPIAASGKLRTNHNRDRWKYAASCSRNSMHPTPPYFSGTLWWHVERARMGETCENPEFPRKAEPAARVEEIKAAPFVGCMWTPLHKSLFGQWSFKGGAFQ